MTKRKETMPDGRRYIIYYDFGDEMPAEPEGNEQAGEGSTEKDVRT